MDFADVFDQFEIAWYVWLFLAPLPLLWRLHQVGRSFLSPFKALIDRIPARNTGAPQTLLDLGCGHGIFLALAKQRRPDLQLLGIDLSESKIASARKAFVAAGLDAEELAVRDIADFAPHSADVISILDVMYLVPIGEWDAILEKCYACLKPGGVLLLKEMNRDIRWKFALLWLEETLSVKVFGLTMGDKFTFPKPQEIRERMEHAGFSVTQTRLDRFYYVPHMLWTGQKAAA